MFIHIRNPIYKYLAFLVVLSLGIVLNIVLWISDVNNTSNRRDLEKTEKENQLKVFDKIANIAIDICKKPNVKSQARRHEPISKIIAANYSTGIPSDREVPPNLVAKTPEECDAVLVFERSSIAYEYIPRGMGLQHSCNLWLFDCRTYNVIDYITLTGSMPASQYREGQPTPWGSEVTISDFRDWLLEDSHMISPIAETIQPDEITGDYPWVITLFFLGGLFIFTIYKLGRLVKSW